MTGTSVNSSSLSYPALLALRKLLDGSCFASEFELVPKGTAYLLMRKLEYAGWVTSKSFDTGRRPAKRYALTSVGRVEVKELLKPLQGAV